MKLYVDDVLLSEDPKENDLEAALARLRKAGAGSIKLRGDGWRCLSATLDKNGWFLDVQQRDACFGLQVDAERAVAAFREFLSGFTPRLPWKPIRPKKGEILASIVMGDPYHPDCPLCRMGL